MPCSEASQSRSCKEILGIHSSFLGHIEHVVAQVGHTWLGSRLHVQTELVREAQTKPKPNWRPRMMASNLSQDSQLTTHPQHACGCPFSCPLTVAMFMRKLIS
ncbi:hypothetical protein PVL29_019141 [Vitis rotundifolia]|uniref:Uncharacterized protein n=1 Tax=Vitis rotundifolia TaxID=103349 RepID=A0AA38Z7Q5_VITRO|nr:hypothetical protein PVL29_019141 [Vitis rotundifolia]